MSNLKSVANKVDFFENLIVKNAKSTALQNAERVAAAEAERKAIAVERKAADEAKRLEEIIQKIRDDYMAQLNLHPYWRERRSVEDVINDYLRNRQPHGGYKKQSHKRKGKSKKKKIFRSHKKSKNTKNKK